MGQTNSTESTSSASASATSLAALLIQKNKPPINILVFGRSNVGKSSLINALLGPSSDLLLPVDSAAIGCTFKTRAVSVMKDGQKFEFYDTAGFNEANEGRVNKIDAICNLIQLLKELKTISLIVYVRKCEVIDEIDEKNYQLIIETLMEQRVPTLCVNTYADNEGDDMNAWWQRNKSIFQKHTTVRFQHGCSVIVGNPKIKALVDTYRKYRQKAAELVWKSINEQILNVKPIKLSKKSFISTFIRFINKLLGISLSCQVPRKKEILIRKLKEQGFKDDEVKKLMNEISTLVFFNQSAEKNKAVHVVVFGRSNVGKSSLVNLLTDSNLETAANAAGCTIKTTKNCYIRNSITYHLYDTAGLNEAGGGSVEKIDAICKLIDSFKRIKKINMVAYVRKCDSLTELDEKNYNLIIRILLQNRVKSLCINTYADNEEEQMDWWKRNGKSFETRSMKFSKGVSVVVGKPKIQELQAVYDNRLRKAKTILLDAIDECRSEPIDFSQVKWIDFFLEMINHYCGTRFEVNQPRDVEHLKKKLVDAGFKDDEADKLTGELKTLLLINNQRQKQDDSNSDSDENNLSS